MRRAMAAVVILVLTSCGAPTGSVATKPEFNRWLAQDDSRAAIFARFEAMLEHEGVGGVVPAYDLWLVDRLRMRCVAEPYAAPPEGAWGDIVPTLRFIRDYVEPAIGDVRVVSAYRDVAFNECVGGAPASAHRGFTAVDLIPTDRAVTRQRLIDALCGVHAREGPRFRVGLGIYESRRFHIDTHSYRGWGHDHHGVTFPCRAAARA